MEKIEIDEYYLSEDVLRDFITTIKNIPTATKESNAELKKQVIAGEDEAYMNMFYENMRLVTSIVLGTNYHMKINQKMDLLQEGLVELLKSIDSFDPEKGSFSNYTQTKIRARLRSYMQKTEPFISKPRDFQDHRKKYNDIWRQCKMLGTPLPKDDELREIIGVTQRELEQIKIDYLLEDISFETTREFESNLPKSLVSDDIESSLTLKELLTILKLKFDSYTYYITYSRYVEEKTYAEIGNEFHVKRQAIEQQTSSSLRKLRSLFDEERLLRIPLTWMSSKKIPRDFNIHPISPKNITAYLFVKNELSEEEKRKLKNFIFTNDDSYSLPKSLKDKISKYMRQNITLYESFHDKMMETYQTSIYEVDLTLDVSPYLEETEPQNRTSYHLEPLS